jgi:hypothetical protein
MSKKITIGSNQYNLSLQGDPAGWGEEQADLLEAIVNAINGFYGPGDILPISATIFNVTPTFKPVPYLQFNSTVVRFAEINYTILRTSQISITPVVNNIVYEVGKIFALNDPNTGAWSINVQNMSGNGDVLADVYVDGDGANGVAGVEFSINSSGQLLYKSRQMAGTYLESASRINFSAKAITK